MQSNMAGRVFLLMMTSSANVYRFFNRGKKQADALCVRFNILSVYLSRLLLLTMESLRRNSTSAFSKFTNWGRREEFI